MCTGRHGLSRHRCSHTTFGRLRASMLAIIGGEFCDRLQNEEQPIAEPIKKHFYLISTYRRESVKVHRVTRFFPIISRPSKEISRQLVAGLEELAPLLDESSTIDQYGARRHRFQRENNEICSIIGRQFIVAEWFLLRLTTAGTEGATEHSKEDNLP